MKSKKSLYLLSLIIFIASGLLAFESVTIFKDILNNTIQNWTNDIKQAYMQLVLVMGIEILIIFIVLLLNIINKININEKIIELENEKTDFIKTIEKLNNKINEHKIFISTDGMWDKKAIGKILNNILSKKIYPFTCATISCKNEEEANNFRMHCHFVLNDNVIKIELDKLNYLLIFLNGYYETAENSLNLVKTENTIINKIYEMDNEICICKQVIDIMNINQYVKEEPYTDLESE